MKTIIAILLTLCTSLPVIPVGSKPNLILIMVDDMG